MSRTLLPDGSTFSDRPFLDHMREIMTDTYELSDADFRSIVGDRLRTIRIYEEEIMTEEPKEPKKQNRHVVIALNHMNKRRDVLLEQRAKLNKEIEELDAAILALD